MLFKNLIYGSAALCGSYYGMRNFVSISKVTGESMYPSLNPYRGKNDWVVLDERLSRNYSDINRGDVVVFRSTRNPDEYNVKRVIGLEGDTVKTIGYKNKYVKVPVGHCWLEGDNSSNSDDSNRTGPIPIGLITAKARYIITRLQEIERRFPHSRVVLNPDTGIDVLHKVHKLPSLEYKTPEKYPQPKLNLNVNAAETKRDS